MRHVTFYSGLFAFLSMLLSGCCVSHSLAIKNDTGVFVAATAKDTGREVGIPAGQQRKLEFWEGPMIVTVGSNLWFYPKIGYREHPEATKRVYRFGICQAGFGYFVTHATLERDGRLLVGNGTYEPERKAQ